MTVSMKILTFATIRTVNMNISDIIELFRNPVSFWHKYGIQIAYILLSLLIIGSKLIYIKSIEISWEDNSIEDTYFGLVFMPGSFLYMAAFCFIRCIQFEEYADWMNDISLAPLLDILFIICLCVMPLIVIKGALPWYLFASIFVLGIVLSHISTRLFDHKLKRSQYNLFWRGYNDRLYFGRGARTIGKFIVCCLIMSVIVAILVISQIHEK